MRKQMGVSRRGFMKMAASAATCEVALPAWTLPSSGRAEHSGLAFVGVSGQTDADGQIRCYSIDAGRWSLLQETSSAAPVAIVLHPDGRTLYVLNEVREYKGLARGSVEAFRIDNERRTFEQLGREPLSLSATMPRSMAVAPDGKSLVVAVHGGGAYNLLPISPDGRLGRISGILKETGCGPVAEEQESAHPHKIAFDATGERFFSVDYGCDQVSLFSLRNGMARVARFRADAGSGPSDLALHPGGRLVFVGHALDGSISTLSHDDGDGEVSQLAVCQEAGFRAGMVLSADGGSLYTAAGGEIRVWKIDPERGTLKRIQSRLINAEDGPQRIQSMALTPRARQLLTLTDLGVSTLDLEPGTNRLGTPIAVAPVPGARCFALA